MGQIGFGNLDVNESPIFWHPGCLRLDVRELWQSQKRCLESNSAGRAGDTPLHAFSPNELYFHNLCGSLGIYLEWFRTFKGN